MGILVLYFAVLRVYFTMMYALSSTLLVLVGLLHIASSQTTADPRAAIFASQNDPRNTKPREGDTCEPAPIGGSNIYNDVEKCYLSKELPAKADFNFKMCRHYNNKACCLTGHDADIMANFETLTDVGLECPYRKRNKAPELWQWNCMGCSPESRNWVDPRCPTVGGNPGRLMICSDFVRRMWTGGEGYPKEWEKAGGIFADKPWAIGNFTNTGLIPEYGTRYDGCALRIVNFDCGDVLEECGDDIVVPSATYNPNDYFDYYLAMNHIEVGYGTADAEVILGVIPPLMSVPDGDWEFQIVESNPDDLDDPTTELGQLRAAYPNWNTWEEGDKRKPYCFGSGSTISPSFVLISAFLFLTHLFYF